VRGFWPVFRKEAVQMIRDKGSLRFALLTPAFQLVLFGLIDMNVKHVRTVVYDQSRTAESRQIVNDFVNTSYFDVVADCALSRRAARVHRRGTRVRGPRDPARLRAPAPERQPADFLVLIDGSDSTISSQALAAANGVALSRSISELAEKAGAKDLPIRTHPLLLFNPDSRTANLLIPGLVAILLTFSGTILAAFAIVRERERGTLEQLMVTPASPIAVMLGKLLPYLVLAFIQLLFVLFLMVVVFRVPIHGSLPLLLALATIYIFALLSLGLLVSSRARTQMEAIQGAQAFLLPRSCCPVTFSRSRRCPGPCAWSRRSCRRRTSSRSRAGSSSAAPRFRTCGGAWWR
jgi:ABC-2 type transport system permease protein